MGALTHMDLQDSHCSPSFAQSSAEFSKPVPEPTEWKRFFFRRSSNKSVENHCGRVGESSATRTEKMARLEAALFVATNPLSTRRLTMFATLADAAEVRKLIEELNRAYDETDSSFRIERVASGYQLLTRPMYAEWLHRIHRRQTALKLSPPAMETLTIVAYRQPIKRVDIEAIRGVQSAEILKQLMERNLVRIGGEEDSLGRPYLYVTTRQFLELFGFRNLDDLPMADSLRKPASVSQDATRTETDDEDSETPETSPETSETEENEPHDRNDRAA